ncbi:tRNA pseudouridine(55) synthase TruB [Legionella septentrionalis]|uniref:tRNA pseudouridine(55) synthase TruB n=1 Tax=Legionella septentrionalis TaxID=2498109 RepID=UPI000F8E2293|nr:tRNA pseudouridine(55) synthase TruB [Legionella septentrionalis]RUR11293.1 tRNA pseudouridine(55) synthase TruB [Legionella septentrionalis]
MKTNKTDKQSINGILLVNKPLGLTSNGVLQRVKRLYNAKKAGHTGSLDPLATGMLPVCFGEATKFSQYLLDADKCYEVTARLGIKTTTGDTAGEMIAVVNDFSIPLDELQHALKYFIGTTQQTPSMFSALKHQGTPLYKLARAGIEVPRQPRDIHIQEIELLHFDGVEFKLKVLCSKGTYIRNLIEDLGDKLGAGAHVTQLHRVYTLGFKDEPMYTLENLHAQPSSELCQRLLPMDRAVWHLPKSFLQAEEVSALRQGKIIGTAERITGCIRLYQQTDAQFLGLGEIQDKGLLKVKRLLAADAIQ